MADMPQFEIPATVRELAERNVEQARSAYNQFLDMARQPGPGGPGVRCHGPERTRLPVKALRYAERNLDPNFAFVSDRPGHGISRNTSRCSRAMRNARCRLTPSRPRSWGA